MTKKLIAALSAAISMCASAATINFSTFVTQADIAAAESNNSTIGFTYAGNKFVGSVYFGANNNQLYSTSLTGGNVQKFSSPIPGAGGEVVLGASLGQAGFAKGDIFAGSGNNGQIYHISNAGGAPTLFATVPVGGVRGIFFDPGSSFGGDMLVSTNAGDIYRVNGAGHVTLLASVGEDTEGMDIATSAWGTHAGDLLVGSENSGSLRLITPGGVATVIAHVPEAETVSFVPLNLGVSGNPVEGFYAANYPVNVQYANASQFAGLQGDAIITSEFSSNAPLWDLKYNIATDTFSVVSTPLGNLPNQSEDGIFVTAARISGTGGGVPEPSSVALMGSGLIGLGFLLRRRLRG